MLLLIDNYDSFTYNLYHYLLELGQEVMVKNRDEIDLVWIEELRPDYIVLSPGPGNPAQAELPLMVIDRFKGSIPILGVCLGHQCIAHYFGGKVIQGDRPVHGKVSPMHHDGKGVYAGLVSPFEVTRYHSLVISRCDFPDQLEITAWTEDGVVMGIRHKTYAIEGVQFHPEAILTKNGHKLLKNFLEGGQHDYND